MVLLQMVKRGNNEPIPHLKTNFSKQHKCEIFIRIFPTICFGHTGEKTLRMVRLMLKHTATLLSFSIASILEQTHISNR